MAGVINLQAAGGTSTSVDMGTAVYSFLVRYNYSARCWSLDISDAQGDVLAAGLMLVPGVDLLRPYPALRESIGGLTIYEKADGDYQSDSKLGTDVKLIWFPVGEEVVTQ